MYPVEVRYRAPVAEGSKEGRAGSPPQDLEEFDLEAAVLAAVDELSELPPGDILVS